MAKKIDAPSGKKDAQRAAEELEVIAPEISGAIDGRLVTMREPTWLESMEFDSDLEPVIESVSEMIGEDQKAPSWGVMARLMYRHRDVLLNMMSLCSGCEREWLEGLNDRDGQSFAALFWSVNGHFFGRRVLLMRAQRVAAAGRAGPMSSPH